MKKTLAILAVAIMTAVCVQAQKIQTVDTDGNAIPLVSVMSEDGVLIGTTDLNGILADVKGASKVGVTHVAFKPQLVSVASLTDGRIIMEEVDYDLDEIVVKPKPYLYIEFYFRGFSYIGDSLRTYAAGIIPVAYEIQNKYNSKTRSIWSYGGAANKALSWNTISLLSNAEKGVKGAVKAVETLIRESEKFNDYYKVSMEQDGENRWIVRNPEEVIGSFLHDDGLYRATLDGGKMQLYANKVNGEDRQKKARENRNYDFQYTEVFALDEDGKIQPFNYVMEVAKWEYDSSKGRRIEILYLYAADRGYMDAAEFKARSKELNKGYAGDMSLEELAEYERAHNIPSLAPTQLKAIQGLTKQTGMKK